MTPLQASRSPTMDSSLDQLDGEWITDHLESIRLEESQKISAQGQDMNQFYFVRRGLLGLFRDIYPNKSVLVEKIIEGEPVGLTQMLSGGTMPANVVAIKETIAYRGSRSDLEKLTKKHPEWLSNLLLHESQNQSSLFQQIDNLVSKELKQRIAGELVDLANKLGRETEDGIEIVVKLTRKQISEMVGSTQESVIRILSDWEQSGLISTVKKQITLKQPEHLLGIANG
ncbi:MAG: Crp/Fnr family transcriptional regulator [bacterium]